MVRPFALLVLLALVGVVQARPLQAQEGGAKGLKEAYEKLFGEYAPLLCESAEAASVGYYNKRVAEAKTAFKVSGPLETQRIPSQWRIDFSKGHALVTRYSGTFQQIEAQQVWSV